MKNLQSVVETKPPTPDIHRPGKFLSRRIRPIDRTPLFFLTETKNRKQKACVTELTEGGHGLLFLKRGDRSYGGGRLDVK